MTTSAPPLRDALEDYLLLRRALGFKLASAARLPGQFISYLEARGTSTVTTSDALAWATLPAGASPAWQAIRLSAVRGFAACLHGIDPPVQVPPAGLIRRGNDRATPYLYSDAEISALVAAAAGLRPRLRAATYQTLISLLAVSGIFSRGRQPVARRGNETLHGKLLQHLSQVWCMLSSLLRALTETGCNVCNTLSSRR